MEIMKRSSMGRQQKMYTMATIMMRRLANINLIRKNLNEKNGYGRPS